MATSAFKSTTKRTSIGGNSSAGGSGSSDKSHRRSRSLSRFSRPLLDSASDFGETPARRGKFVNTVRGSGVPEISLDDLAVEFFSILDSSDERDSGRGRLSRRLSEVSPANAASVSSQRRGRSVSRHKSRVRDGKDNFPNASGGGRTAPDVHSRRRRSVSVFGCPIGASENDGDHSQNSSNVTMKSYNGGKSQMPSLQKPTASNHRRLGRSLSQKDLSRMHDGYLSQSSALTDDESRDGHSSKNMSEKTIRAVYAQKKAEHPTGDDVNSGLYEVMRKELRDAVDEIKMELGQAMVRKTSASANANCLQSDKSNGLHAASTIRKHYATKLGKSEKQREDLLAELILEEQRGMEASNFVRELPPDPKSSTIAEKPVRARKKSKDRSRMSSRLAEEAEKYLEDFMSNLEDTDISSYDGDRSDTSSTLGATRARGTTCHSREKEMFQSPAGSKSLPVEMEGVILPWLQWETSNDGSPIPFKDKRDLPVTPKSILWDAAEEIISAQDPSPNSTSSTGSWNPSSSLNTSNSTRNMLQELGSRQRADFDMDRYLKLQKDEDLLFNTWRERHMINSGGLLLCSNSFI